MPRNFTTIAFLLLLTIGLFTPAGLKAQDEEDSTLFDNVTKGEEMGEEVKKALEVLTSYHSAETWQELLPMSIDGDLLEERMAAHYEVFPWEAFEPAGIQFLGGARKRGPTGDESYLALDFGLLMPVDDRRPSHGATLVQTEEGYKVDWELFAQFGDNSFERFRDEKPGGEHIFRLSVQRGVPSRSEEELLDGDVQRVIAHWRPDDRDTVNLFCTNSSEAGSKVRDHMAWDSYRPFRVTLEWVTKGEEAFIHLKVVEQMTFDTPSVFKRD